MNLENDILIQRGEAGSAAPRLLLLFHGVDSSAENLRPLGQALAAQRPPAWVFNVRSPDPSDLSQGWQWFAVQGVTEPNRAACVAHTMPRFVETVQAWQRETGVAAPGTVLLGFSQGAIMALVSTQQPQPLAGRVIAIADRFAQTPRSAPSGLAQASLPATQPAVERLALGRAFARQRRRHRSRFTSHQIRLPRTMTMCRDHGHIVKQQSSIAAGEFKAECLSLLDSVARTRRPLVITKRGKPVAQLVPMPDAPALFGALAGSVVHEDDLVSGLGETWDAQR
jgi:phospholipase/carboxylesterase